MLTLVLLTYFDPTCRVFFSDVTTNSLEVIVIKPSLPDNNRHVDNKCYVV